MRGARQRCHFNEDLDTQKGTKGMASVHSVWSINMSTNARDRAVNAANRDDDVRELAKLNADYLSSDQNSNVTRYAPSRQVVGIGANVISEDITT
jgi:hypothetical protein